MNNKKKKNHPQTGKAGAQNDQKEMRFKPAARNLLLINLVFLATSQMLYNSGILSPTLSGVCTLAGVVLLFLSGWIQFSSSFPDNSGSNSRLK